MGLTVAGKNTRISLLHMEYNRNSPWSNTDQSNQVDHALDCARAEFGASGTQTGRRWFYRFRKEIHWVQVVESDTKWHSIPRVRYWCDLYFRDPRDATWLRLKTNS